MSIRRISVAAAMALAMAITLPATARASDLQVEIDYLLEAVGQSGCTFVRNGSEHSAADAVEHLRLKYRKGKQYVSTTEQFIERLATASSWTGRPYLIACPDVPVRPSGEWLTDRLAEYRRTHAQTTR